MNTASGRLPVTVTLPVDRKTSTKSSTTHARVHVHAHASQHAFRNWLDTSQLESQSGQTKTKQVAPHPNIPPTPLHHFSTSPLPLSPSPSLINSTDTHVWLKGKSAEKARIFDIYISMFVFDRVC